MKAMTTDPEGQALSVQVPGVLGKLEATRRELKRSRMWLGLATILLGELLLGAVFILADWMWVLPPSCAAWGLLAMVALAVFLHFRIRHQWNSDQAAAEVEAHFHELGQRLRTVVEYAEPRRAPVPASPGLIRALGRDTDKRTAGLDFRKLVPWAPFERPGNRIVLRRDIRDHRPAHESRSFERPRSECCSSSPSLHDDRGRAWRRDRESRRRAEAQNHVERSSSKGGSLVLPRDRDGLKLDLGLAGSRPRHG